jgi:glycosyltransferase involved in cell wall biosynthesis
MYTARPMPYQIEFVLLSFEGPDPYSQAGGLGVRITNIAKCLASQGYPVHLIFIGSPDLPSHEVQYEGRLHYHRWCQWISYYHPLGVYDGEEGKLFDFTRSVPEFIVEQIAAPAVAQGRHLIVLAEEWQTAEALIRISDQLYTAGLRANSILLWNANNTKGFERIDWRRLDFVSTVTTVSRYMKHIMKDYGLDPLVIPNGIPSDLIRPIPQTEVDWVHERLAGEDGLLMFKVARYDPDKCWMSAIEAAAYLKQNGAKISFLCRGGIEPYGNHVFSHARELGLVVEEVDDHPETWEDALEVIQATRSADIYNLRFRMSPSMLRIFYAAADFVLANSKHEPFGLVGLEAMAAGGVIITGCTGETYSIDGTGAIALDSENVSELVHVIEFLLNHPQRSQAIREAGPKVAARYTWNNIIEILLEKINLAGEHQRVYPFKAAAINPADTMWEAELRGITQHPMELALPAWPGMPEMTPLKNVASSPSNF